VMYGYHKDQNPEDGICSLNFEALHRSFVKQWEMTQLTIGRSVFIFCLISNKQLVQISSYFTKICRV
jgi:hypothetical protein